MDILEKKIQDYTVCNLVGEITDRSLVLDGNKIKVSKLGFKFISK